jgi:hypothetical protein
MLDADDDPEHPHHYRLVTDVLGRNQNTPGRSERLFFVEEPNTFADVELHSCWRQAMMEEMSSWTLADLPPGHRPIGLKWVFKMKKDATSAVIKHKARLIAKGYVQREGVDFDEVFAPVARLDSVRLMAAVAAREKWQLHHLDVKSAFLNGDLEEKVYVSQPPGFERNGKEWKVHRLHKRCTGYVKLLAHGTPSWTVP